MATHENELPIILDSVFFGAEPPHLWLTLVFSNSDLWIILLHIYYFQQLDLRLTFLKKCLFVSINERNRIQTKRGNWKLFAVTRPLEKGIMMKIRQSPIHAWISGETKFALLDKQTEIFCWINRWYSAIMQTTCKNLVIVSAELDPGINDICSQLCIYRLFSVIPIKWGNLHLFQSDNDLDDLMKFPNTQFSQEKTLIPHSYSVQAFGAIIHRPGMLIWTIVLVKK